MYIIKTIQGLRAYIQELKSAQKTIGFAPTMGALHEGHLSLIRASLEDGHQTICSIFVNPTQFNEKNDLEKYPRPIEQDIELLIQVGCHVLFLPDASEIYPEDLTTPFFDLKGLDLSMEGGKRPGHFAGVVQVVHRLLDITTPDSLYMGQKDYQQFTIIKHMLQVMGSPIQLICVPIKRAFDGLAMSSRNVRLSAAGRKRAGLISTLLEQAAHEAKTRTLAEVNSNMLIALEKHDLSYDYFSIVDGDSLKPIQSFDEATIVTACIVVRIDNVRLLDNIILKNIG